MNKRNIPIFVDADFSLADLMRAADAIGCTLHGDGHGGLVILPTKKPAAIGDGGVPVNVIPLNTLQRRER